MVVDFPAYPRLFPEIKQTKVLGHDGQKVKVEFTAASGGKKLTLWLNAVQFEGKPSLNGPGAGNVTYNFTAHAVATAPTGFPTNGVDALTVELLTSASTLYLA